MPWTRRSTSSSASPDRRGMSVSPLNTEDGRSPCRGSNVRIGDDVVAQERLLREVRHREAVRRRRRIHGCQQTFRVDRRFRTGAARRPIAGTAKNTRPSTPRHSTRPSRQTPASTVASTRPTPMWRRAGRQSLWRRWASPPSSGSEAWRGLGFESGVRAADFLDPLFMSMDNTLLTTPGSGSAGTSPGTPTVISPPRWDGLPRRRSSCRSARTCSSPSATVPPSRN